ncbi:MAG: ATP-binding cassette domain-containing protein [Atopobiaceae bacterium]|jgi:energy-coupling factor transport system ATP-binding protein|nr:ATP-binding cassette domain-containing protein [Atopobiaceae bacterium]MCI2173485.1 ATP-binding cassette domain-containing protein [Atopobiaceae bacterium]MCI2207480.1 ATP-binding cassette domain-containing protein [Atopobiaceae bacterium]
MSVDRIRSVETGDGAGVESVPALSFSDVTFAYAAVDGATSAGAAATQTVLSHVSLDVPEGAFCLVVGDTGSGKTTALTLAVPAIAPVGELEGHVAVFGRDVDTLSVAEAASTVGYVFQDPEESLVCDTVWHEMAFGLENLGVPADVMRRRVAETSYFFGMGPWFDGDVASLSGGQRQVLALASVLAMRPRLLLLDEPTSMLDPIAEKSFLSALFRVNRELGITIVVATHRPAPMVDYATMAVGMHEGGVRPVDLDSLRGPGDRLSVHGSPRDGDADALMGVIGRKAESRPAGVRGRCSLSLSDVWFRYGREDPWVLKGLDLELPMGGTGALVGGNGCGKSTILSLVAGSLRPRRGRVDVASASSVAYLPQDPKALLVAADVVSELMEWSGRGGYGPGEVDAVLSSMGLAGMGERHPYDLSGGQRQLLALAKLLLMRPRLLLLDEPTKGLDLSARDQVADVVRSLSDEGVSVLVATHDLEFARATADQVSMVFDGEVACTEPPADFFADNLFYQA